MTEKIANLESVTGGSKCLLRDVDNATDDRGTCAKSGDKVNFTVVPGYGI